MLRVSWKSEILDQLNSSVVQWRRWFKSNHVGCIPFVTEENEANSKQSEKIDDLKSPMPMIWRDRPIDRSKRGCDDRNRHFRVLVAALTELGAGFVGVTQLPANCSTDAITAQDAAGVRTVRFNQRRGGSAGLGVIKTLAKRVHDIVGWHAEVYLDGIRPS